MSLRAEAAVGVAAQAFQCEYTVLRDGKTIGAATVTLTQGADGTWQFESNTRGTQGLAALAGVSIVENSLFRWQENRPELIEYRYLQDSAFSARERRLQVDATRQHIASQDKKINATLPFEPGVVDRHTVVLAIAADLAHGVEQLSYRVADKNRIETQRYRRAATLEKFSLADREVDAIKVERLRDNPGRHTTLWLLQEFPYVPLRILHQETDGETMEMRLLRRLR